LAGFRDGGEFGGGKLRQAGRGAAGILIANDAENFFDGGALKLGEREGGLGGEQFVKQHAERIEVAAGVHVLAHQPGLFRAHVGGRAGELIEGRGQRVGGQAVAERGPGDAEINDLGARLAVLFGDEDVRGLEVAVDDAFLMRVLDGLADLDEEREAGGQGKGVCIAVVGDARAGHVIHDEKRPAGGGGPAIEDAGDVGMVHPGKGFPLDRETGHHRAGVQAELEDFQRDLAVDGFVLLGQKHDAKTALADLAQEAVGADAVAGLLKAGGEARSSGGAGGEGFVRLRGRRGQAEAQQAAQAVAAGGVVRQFRSAAGAFVGVNHALMGWARVGCPVHTQANRSRCYRRRERNPKSEVRSAAFKIVRADVRRLRFC